MSTLQWILIFIVGFWALIYILDKKYDLKSKGADLSPGILLLRTGWGIEILDKIANKSKTLWKIFGITGVITGIYLMGRIFHILTEGAIQIISTIGAGGGGGGGMTARAAPIIPGITTPLLSGLIGIVIVVLVHEGAHGVVARRIGLSLESTGVGVMAFLPLAFVEPDEEEMESSPLLEKLQVFGAGSFSNIITGFLFLILLTCLVVPLSGVYVGGVFENTPANDVLKPGMKIEGIGYSASSLQDVDDYSTFDNFMESTRPGDEVTVKSGDNFYDLVLENREDREEGFMGIAPVQSVSRFELVEKQFATIFFFWESPGVSLGGINPYSYNILVPMSVITALFWIILFNLGVGLFNLLPIGPLDGGRMFRSLLNRFTSEDLAKKITWGVSILTLAIVLVNLYPWFSQTVL